MSCRPRNKKEKKKKREKKKKDPAVSQGSFSTPNLLQEIASSVLHSISWFLTLPNGFFFLCTLRDWFLSFLSKL